MQERWIDRVRRELHDWHKRIVQRAIKRLAHRLDELNYGAFMALSLWQDDRTTYHLIAERHLENCHVYGTEVDYYDGETQ